MRAKIHKKIMRYSCQKFKKIRVDLVSEIKGERKEKRTPILKKIGPCNLAWLQWIFTEEYKANLLEATFLIKFHLIGPVEWIILTGALNVGICKCYTAKIIAEFIAAWAEKN